jgi:hypothetical protein
MGYFSLLAFGILLVIAAAIGRRRFYRALRARWWALAAAAGGFAIGFVPFALTYLPVQGEVPSSTEAQILGYAGGAQNLANYGRANLFWSSLIHTVLPRISTRTYELSYAVTPLVMTAAIAGAVCCLVWLRRGTALRRPMAKAAVVLGSATLVVAFLPVRTRIVTPWKLVRLLPGASAMRAVDRIEIVVGFLAVMTVAAALAEIWAHEWSGWRRYSRVALVGLCALMVGEQLNSSAVSHINRHEQVALLAEVKPPPAECRVFYLTDSSYSTAPWFDYQVDAMLISQRAGIPTLNGYTAYSPPGWLLRGVLESDYQFNVSQWILFKGVQTGVCALDLHGMVWSIAPGSSAAPQVASSTIQGSKQS